MAILKQAKAKDFLLSGHAFCTFTNTHPLNKDEASYSYRIKKKDGVWFVYYVFYIGYIKPDLSFTAATKDTVGREKAIAVFAWVWNKIIKLSVPDNILMYHNGRCSHCGKLLTDETSIEYGIGPTCRAKLGIL